MHLSTAIAAVYAAGPVAALTIGSRDGVNYTTPKFVPRAISDNMTFHLHPLGMYHPNLWKNPYEGIADLWGGAGGDVMDQDYVYLTGPDADSLALVWNRPQAQSLYFGVENEPLQVNNSATADASRQLTGLSIGAEDNLIYIKDDAFSFTACLTSGWLIEVSYIKKGSTGLSDDCTPIRILAGERLESATKDVRADLK